MGKLHKFIVMVHKIARRISYSTWLPLEGGGPLNFENDDYNYSSDESYTTDDDISDDDD